jgi:hypothetical protein
MFKEYFDKHLKNDFITSFKSTCAASILFIKKKTSDLRYALIIENWMQ